MSMKKKKKPRRGDTVLLPRITSTVNCETRSRNAGENAKKAPIRIQIFAKTQRANRPQRRISCLELCPCSFFFFLFFPSPFFVALPSFIFFLLRQSSGTNIFSGTKIARRDPGVTVILISNARRVSRVSCQTRYPTAFGIKRERSGRP